LGAGGFQEEFFEGEFAFPEWRARGFLRASYDDLTASWETNFLSGVRADEDIIAQDIFSSVADGLSDTCLGPGAGDELCRNVNSAGSYFTHNVALSYGNEDFRVGLGVRNIFANDPPRIDTASVFGTNNVPLGAGYDLNGRRFFANILKRF